MMRTTLQHFIQGGLIGVGNIIPGVSGATVALILGIYKRLLTAIDSLSPKAILSLVKSLTSPQKFAEEMRKVHGWFLMTVFFGVVTFVYVFSFAISYFLDNHHDATYSLFFGLILASIVIPFKFIEKKTWYGWLAFALAVVLVVVLSTSMSVDEKVKAHSKKTAIKSGKVEQAQTPKRDYGVLMYYFVAGAIAISAMILPGISGSFILLLLGSYFDVLLAVKQLNLPILAFFGSGCLVGLIAFTKVMKFLLEKYESLLMFFLSGLILGSLYSIWPFKEQLESNGIVFYGGNIIPGMNTNLFVCVLMCVIGVGVVFGFQKYEKKEV